MKNVTQDRNRELLQCLSCGVPLILWGEDAKMETGQPIFKRCNRCRESRRKWMENKRASQKKLKAARAFDNYDEKMRTL